MRIKLLDYGYLEFIEHWGSDERIIEAARMSTNKGFVSWGPICCADCCGSGKMIESQTLGNEIPESECKKCKGKGQIAGDEKLLAFLWNNKHVTPFEMAGMVIEVKAPIFVFREWHRHRTQSYNEMSARYTPLPNDNYLPTVERCLVVGGTNKQASGLGNQLTHEKALSWLQLLENGYKLAEDVYQLGLKEGIPKELARLILPVGRYSKMRASANLRNWLAFLTLRSAENAQYEIQVFANAVGELIKEKYPRTWELYQLNH